MQYASVLLFNAVVLTLDGNDAVASALALDGDRILAVGDRDGLVPLIGPRESLGSARKQEPQGFPVVSQNT